MSSHWTIQLVVLSIGVLLFATGIWIDYIQERRAK